MTESEFIYILTLSCSRQYGHYPMINEAKQGEYPCEECKQEQKLRETPMRDIIKCRKLRRSIAF